MDIEGEISGAGSVTIHGHVRGHIKVRQDVEVARDARVEANIEAMNVAVHGVVTGDIRAADKVEVSINAEVNGDIKAPRVMGCKRHQRLAPELAPNVSIQAGIRRDGEGGAYSETLINLDISLLAGTGRDA